MTKHKSNADTMTAWQTPTGQLPLDLADRRTEMESLRTFALAHGEMAFAHLVTAALGGEEWAVERIDDALYALTAINEPSSWTLAPYAERSVLDVIRSTDTTRPEGSTSRTLTDV